MRAPWDRIAYCGKVPVNVQIAQADVGKCLSAVAGENDTIAAAVGPVGDNAIGRIRKRLNDGRAVVAVRP